MIMPLRVILGMDRFGVNRVRLDVWTEKTGKWMPVKETNHVPETRQDIVMDRSVNHGTYPKSIAKRVTVTSPKRYAECYPTAQRVFDAVAHHIPHTHVDRFYRMEGGVRNNNASKCIAVVGWPFVSVQQHRMHQKCSKSDTPIDSGHTSEGEPWKVFHYSGTSYWMGTSTTDTPGLSEWNLTTT